MSLLNPNVHATRAPTRQAASLRKTLDWMARHALDVMERIGQRRAAPVLLRLGQRLSDDGHEAGPRLVQTAREWAKS